MGVEAYLFGEQPTGKRVEIILSCDYENKCLRRTAKDFNATHSMRLKAS